MFLVDGNGMKGFFYGSLLEVKLVVILGKAPNAA